MITLVSLLMVGLVLCDQYTTKYDNINIDEILSSERLLKNYFNCLMSRGPCTPDAEELRKVLPEALQTECAKCNDKQKEGTKRVVKFLIDKKPEMWKELAQKYDPQGIYFNKYKDNLNS